MALTLKLPIVAQMAPILILTRLIVTVTTTAHRLLILHRTLALSHALQREDLPTHLTQLVNLTIIAYIAVVRIFSTIILAHLRLYSIPIAKSVLQIILVRPNIDILLRLYIFKKKKRLRVMMC